jgi:hypothetical protein
VTNMESDLHNITVAGVLPGANAQTYQVKVSLAELQQSSTTEGNVSKGTAARQARKLAKDLGAGLKQVTVKVPIQHVPVFLGLAKDLKSGTGISEALTKASVTVRGGVTCHNNPVTNHVAQSRQANDAAKSIGKSIEMHKAVPLKSHIATAQGKYSLMTAIRDLMWTVYDFILDHKKEIVIFYLVGGVLIVWRFLTQ